MRPCPDMGGPAHRGDGRGNGRTSTTMHTIQTKRALREDFPRIAVLIADQNRAPETQCTHSGEGRNSILQVMNKWEEASEICFATALRNDNLVGTFGCEFDEALGRGWLWGPFALTADWAEVASALLDRLLEILPPSIQRLDGFLHVANERGRDFYLSHGFEQLKRHHVYVAARPGEPLRADEACHMLEPGQKESFRRLHDTVFPDTYETGESISAKLDDDHVVFVHTEGDDVVGYIYVAIEDGTREGYVEFLGVRADARRRGVGKGLLLTALKWWFEEKGVSEVGLTVSEEDSGARALYERVGFGLKHSGLNYRMVR
jgi:ribosomal protein S18 acetylase RimI-like enzyme